MGSCQSIPQQSLPYCPLCREYIHDKQHFHCVKCNRNYHVQCFTAHVKDMNTCPACNHDVTKVIKNASINQTSNLGII